MRVNEDLECVAKDLRDHLARSVVLLSHVSINRITLRVVLLVRAVTHLTLQLAVLSTDEVGLLCDHVQVQFTAQREDSLQLRELALATDTLVHGQVLLYFCKGCLVDVSG